MTGLLALPLRLQDKIQPEPMSGCWLWTASLVRGYGQVGRGTRAQGSTGAHRFVYELLVAPLPPGKQTHIHHRCGVKSCVNPAHLQVTPAHAHRHDHHRAEVCPRGHTMTDAFVVNGRGKRTCRVCHCARQRAYHARH